MNPQRYIAVVSFFVAVLLLLPILSGCSGFPHSRGSVNRTDRSGATSYNDSDDDDADLEAKAQAHAHYGAAVIHDLNGEGDAALRELEQAVKLDPQNESLVMEATRRLLQAGHSERALAVVQQAIARNGGSGLLYARKASIQMQLGQNEAALASGRLAIEKSPDLLVAYQQLCTGYLQAKRDVDALAVLDIAARRPATTAEFLVSLSELYTAVSVQSSQLRDEARTKAIEVLDHAEKLQPANIPLRLALADRFSALGESKRAAPIYLEALKELPEIPNLREKVLSKLAEIYLRSEDHQAASVQLKAMLEVDPTNPLVYYYLGSISMEEKKPAEAVDYFSKAMMLKPDFEQTYYDLANAQISLGKGGDALATLDQARKKFSVSFILEYLTGAAFNQQKAFRQARQHYTAAEVIAQASDPKRLTQFFYFQAGAACERDGAYDQAEKYFNLCLEQAPDFTEALNYLGYMWAERGINLVKAREMIEKAVRAEPDNDAFLDSLGWVLFKLNQNQEALAALLKALDHAKEPDATVYDHLGDVYQALGQTEKAAEAWRKSLSIEANETISKKLERTESK